MCKSPSGKCYSMIPYDGESSGSAHGCVESLPAADNAICEQDGDIIKTRSGTHEWPILICCSDDMCNYSDSLDVKIYPVNSKSTGNSVKPGEDYIHCLFPLLEPIGIPQCFKNNC